MLKNFHFFYHSGPGKPVALAWLTNPLFQQATQKHSSRLPRRSQRSLRLFPGSADTLSINVFWKPVPVSAQWSILVYLSKD